MYMVAFMYPSRELAAFDFEHFVNVHLPMGLALTKKHLDLTPKKVVLYSGTRNGDPGAAPPYVAISSVFFETQVQAEKFTGLFAIEEAARLLSEDFPKYTPAPPQVLLAKVTELTDIDGLIEAYDPTPSAQASVGADQVRRLQTAPAGSDRKDPDLRSSGFHKIVQRLIRSTPWRH